MGTIMRMDSYTPVIIIEGFLAFGVVLLLYYLHVREMRQIKAKKAKLEAEQALRLDPHAADAPGVTKESRPETKQATPKAS
ncbi:MAG: hypothetical protein ACO3HS_01905 [Burkholderiaceae bacterium]